MSITMSNDKQRLHPDVHCNVDVSESHKPMKMSDVQRLAMLRSKAKSESGNFSCVDFFKTLLFIATVCTFAFVFYKIAVLQQDVASLSRRLEVLRTTSLDDAYRRTTRPCNCTIPPYYNFNHNRRLRRSASGTQLGSEDASGAAASNNAIDPQIHSDSDRFSAHLRPEEGNTTLTEGELFKWSAHKNHSFIETAGFELVNDQYLFVQVAGYYFIYSQITFNDSLTRTIGHQMVSWGCRSTQGATILMGTSLTQQTRPETDLSHTKKDSVYTGGVVYLAAGDYLAVRPDFGQTSKIEFARLAENTFFGAFMIKKDARGKSLKENCFN